MHRRTSFSTTGFSVTGFRAGLIKYGLRLLLTLGLLAAPLVTFQAVRAEGVRPASLFIPSVAGSGPVQSTPPAADGSVELIIGYDEMVFGATNSSASAVDAALAAYGAQVVETLPGLQAQVISLPSAAADEAQAFLATQPGVAYVEPNYTASGQFAPNDPVYASHQYGPKLIGGPDAWQHTQGSNDVVVAVIDSGAWFDHPDLQSKLAAGWDYVNKHNNPADDHGHGTHVAGIIAASFNNGVGVAGMGGHSRVLVYKVLNQNNTGSYSNISAAIVAAADAGARVINLSLGGASHSITLQNAVQYAWQRDVLIVAAAGNNGSSTPFYPAYYPQVMAVSMSNSSDNIVSLSNYGDWVSVAAPGWAIRSTDWTGALGEYGTRSGTSMAAPHVAGVAALALSVVDLRNHELRSLLETTADDRGAPGFDPYFGHGRVNAGRAIQAALLLVQPEPAPVPTQEPTPKPTQEPMPDPTPVPTQEPKPEPTPIPTQEPTPVPTQEPTPDPTPVPTQEPAPELTPVPATVRSHALEGDSSKWGQDWRARVSVQMVDAHGSGVSSVLVQGAWSGGFSGEASCVTNGRGVCTISSGRIAPSMASADFVITGADHGSYVYDSSGPASIQVSRP